MRQFLLMVAAAGIPLAGGTAITIGDGPPQGLPYDGHGGLSQGGTSRLLYDYAEPERSEILDILFKPNYAASLHMLKISIGGDGQATDGTEPSHMHDRDDLSCDRGYELWLLREARRRNPKIKAYALSWAVPWWVGNGTYYTDDNIATVPSVPTVVASASAAAASAAGAAAAAAAAAAIPSFPQTTTSSGCSALQMPPWRSNSPTGNWNERSWGTPAWTKQFRGAMDSAGFQDTQLIVPDGYLTRDPYTGITEAFKTDTEFKAAVSGIGMHYPCKEPPDTTITGVWGKKFWASEENSAPCTWSRGGGCWGRALNQNWLRLNATSSIAWVDSGPGLMYASEPWSGRYLTSSPIWTGAHTTQFVEVGWTMLFNTTGSSGWLAGGGSYVTYQNPRNTSQWALVVEKLEGACEYCPTPANTADENITVSLSPKLGHGPLSLWSTNSSAYFSLHPPLTPDPGSNSVSLVVRRDSIVTLSPLSTAQHGPPDAPVPARTGLPLPYKNDFQAQKTGEPGKYFADMGGSFTVAAESSNSSNLILKQWVRKENGNNRWGANTAPLTVLGVNSTNYSVAVSILLGPAGYFSPTSVANADPTTGGATQKPHPKPKPTPVTQNFGGVCVRLQSSQGDLYDRKGYCLRLFAKDMVWRLFTGSSTSHNGTLQENPSASWQILELSAQGHAITASVNGQVVANITDILFHDGNVGLDGAFGVQYFDNVLVST
eukprot:gene11556-2101_t